MSEEQKEYIKNNEFNIQFGGRGIAKQKYAKLQQENEYYKNILTEFEKWLEHKYDLISKTFKENDFTNGYLEALDLCLYELKELKEGKK